MLAYTLFGTPAPIGLRSVHLDVGTHSIDDCQENLRHKALTLVKGHKYWLAS